MKYYVSYALQSGFSGLEGFGSAVVQMDHPVENEEDIRILHSRIQVKCAVGIAAVIINFIALH